MVKQTSIKSFFAPKKKKLKTKAPRISGNLLWLERNPKVVPYFVKKAKLNKIRRNMALRSFQKKARNFMFRKKLELKRGLARLGLRDVINDVMSYAGYSR